MNEQTYQITQQQLDRLHTLQNEVSIIQYDVDSIIDGELTKKRLAYDLGRIRGKVEKVALDITNELVKYKSS